VQSTVAVTPVVPVLVSSVEGGFSIPTFLVNTAAQQASMLATGHRLAARSGIEAQAAPALSR